MSYLIKILPLTLLPYELVLSLLNFKRKVTFELKSLETELVIIYLYVVG